MRTRITVSKTIDMQGFCPYVQEEVIIPVTYQKYAPLGDEHTYAIVTQLDCVNGSECPDAANCPVARQKTYW
jgi:hypothetical protein